MKNPVRQMVDVKAVKGTTPRAYETHPNAGSKGAQKARGTVERYTAKMGKIPNK